jgi:hypothetical protein
MYRDTFLGVQSCISQLPTGAKAAAAAAAAAGKSINSSMQQ